MTITAGTFCRGDGKGYLELILEGMEGHETCQYAAYAEIAGGVIIPCSLYWPDEVERTWSAAASRRVVLAFPLLDGTKLALRVVDHRHSDHVLFTYVVESLPSKVRSRLTYRLHAEQAVRIRDIDRRLRSANGHAEVTGIYADGKGGMVLRMSASFPYRADARYALHVYDESGRPLDARTVVLEDDAIPQVHDRNLTVRRLSLSVPLPGHPGTICLCVQSEDDPLDGAFTCLLPPMFSHIVNDCRNELRHASLDPGYDSWLRGRRVSLAELERQRDVASQWFDAPMISVVCVLFRTPERYLRELLRSVLCQSYERFELILVNVSGACDSVDTVLREIRDPRIRVIVADNRSIADNTNVGIREAHGDYLAFVDHDDVIEPDALYRYVSEIREHPQTDLLYCDEDKLTESGRYEWPVFKPAYNPDLLYSYNYITHMLMVSRVALDQVELSPADVAGAQDYDLALKCAEVARDIRNVPYMLYHWREHAGSTSMNADSKPYAVEAGRLALQRHFDRRSIPATVDSLEAMFRYRPRYRFDNPPKVSIVIPTKDHVDLLSTCLNALFERTAYADYEVIVTENNSEDPQTFAYYEELQREHDNVTVVRWPGKGFNYSAICNFGAKHASGDILLFLNNDTEVIDERWLASMAGFFTRPEVGVVGAKLLYRDGLVQHGGVWVSPGGCDYLNQRCGAGELGYMETLQHPFDCAAITGACQMIRRSVFDKIGGFDEKLDVVLNDVDLCLRSNAAGYLTVFDPDALLYHNEFSSRGHDEQDPAKAARAIDEQMRFYARWNKKLLADRGRYFNSNLDQYNGHFKIVY
ncbi:glycosyltransferase family 2 protein [Bifidobacterium sp. 82T10]|uniref:Glycosyltransferase family 2 protein n=1 Tax=Bifidobacterium miconis TaxID=2834435 RepID=A0ABS6WGT2_9BIFI|nr:glycosyltransferase family 2 protein [Bifidobacterium miconis]MBW3093268.1 glycosyltransferase family 2 protein [Bifidobacterium miconis]